MDDIRERPFFKLKYSEQIISSLLMAGAATVGTECCVAPLRHMNMLISDTHLKTETGLFGISRWKALTSVRIDGVSSLWKGSAVFGNIRHQVVGHALNFTLYQQYANLFSRKRKYLIGNTLAGAVTGITAFAVFNPTESISYLKSISRSEAADLYRNLPKALIHTAVYRAIYFGVFEWRLQRRYGTNSYKLRTAGILPMAFTTTCLAHVAAFAASQPDLRNINWMGVFGPKNVITCLANSMVLAAFTSFRNHGNFNISIFGTS